MTATRSLRTKAPLGLVVCMALLMLSAPALFTFQPTIGTTASSSSHAIIDPALAAFRSGDVPVIVQKHDAADLSVERAITTRLGGHITRALPIVHGFAATVPARALGQISALEGIRVISLDRRVLVAEGGGSGSPNSVYRKVVRADDVNAAGVKGQGVTVAVIDTGIAEVADLAGRIVQVSNGGSFGGTSPCKNFSGESNCDDSYGHGTFVAGIIAGNGAASNGKWKGVAPQARLLSVKIAGASGAADVSTLLAAIQWVVSYKDTYSIQVLNLSLGTNSTQTYRSDPMNFAVEQAWEEGIAVVVSASNLGPEPGTISKPGDDPWVITVGATDDQGTPGLGDDTLPNFSSRGPTAADGLAKPDLIAPGGHVISLRAPGSAIDTNFPHYIDGAYRKGSGTSMSTAVVTGAVALMLQQNPSWTPNRVKYALTATAREAASDDPMDVGAGVADAYSATFAAPPGTANVGLDHSTGMGSLDMSRGTVQVQADDADQTVVNGVLTLQLLAYNPATFTAVPWTPLSWQLSQWYGAAWYGAAWYGAAWYGAAWYGAAWYGAAWYGHPEGAAWYGAAWYGAAWYGAWE